MPWTYVFKSLINPTSFMVVWSAILKLYGASLGFGSPNRNLNCYVIILSPKPPSNNTSSIVFFPICTWIIAIWLSIVTIVVPISSTERPTCLSMVVLLIFWIFSSFNFCQRHLFNLGAIWTTLKSKYNLILAFAYQCPEKSLLLWLVSPVNSLLPEIFLHPQK